MTKLFFINLAIDQLWDSENQLATLFSARIPQSEEIIRSNEKLAQYLCGPTDKALLFNANPFDVKDWLNEAREKLNHDERYELWPASVSRLEIALLEIYPKMTLPSWLPKDFPAAELNRKSYIEKWGKVAGLSVPPIEVLSVGQLLEQKLSASAEFPFFLKAEWGAGGGANFLIQSPDDTSLRVLQRQLRDQKNGTWIKQKKIEALHNYSVFGWANSEKPRVMQVQYDQRGQSTEHQVANDQVSQDLMKPFQKIAFELNERHQYQGPFGLDIIVDQQKNYFLIDVNIRFTKTHLIEAAAKRLQLDLEKVISKRVRNFSEKSLEQIQKDIKIYLKTPKEVCYFEAI